MAANDMAGCASVMASMKRFHRRVAHPFFEDADGDSFISGAAKIERIRANTAAEGRTLRRLAKRTRDAAQECEQQRVKFVAVMDEMSLRLNAFVADRFDAKDFKAAYVKALGEQSIKRFSVVNAYLAR